MNMFDIDIHPLNQYTLFLSHSDNAERARGKTKKLDQDNIKEGLNCLWQIELKFREQIPGTMQG